MERGNLTLALIKATTAISEWLVGYFGDDNRKNAAWA